MRLSVPRLSPLPSEDVPEDVRRYTGARAGGPVLNIYRTLARHPKAAKRWLVFGAHVLGKSSLSAREREILILRIGWLCRCEYEWGQHCVIGKREGLSDEAIAAIAQGPSNAVLSPFERTLLSAADELHAEQFISDATWDALRARYDDRQMIDLIFTVGQYTLVCMALNSLGVQLEPGTSGFSSSP